MDACTICELKSNAVAVLNESELGFLEEGCFKTEFDKGEIIIREGMPAQFVIYIRKGFIKQYKKGIGGKEYILSISKKGAFLGIQNLMKNNRTNYFSAKAITKADVCIIDKKSFGKLLHMNGEFAAEVISYICEEEMDYFDRLVSNVQQQLNGRLANILLYFRYEVYAENPFCLNLTKSEMAALIGTSRESVSRLLKEFQSDGIVSIQKNNIEIIDEQKLREINFKG